jgi:cadmium resistance protein CadD (predicted permease)
MTSIFLKSIVAFFSTTIDDFAILLMFYAKAKQMTGILPYVQVIMGQTLGFTFVVICSLTGLILGSFIPQKYLNIIGIIPLILGLRKGYEVLADDGYFTMFSNYLSFSSTNGYTEINEQNTYDHANIFINIPNNSETSEYGLEYSSPRARLGVLIQRGEKPPQTGIIAYIVTCTQGTIESITNPFTHEVFLYTIVCSSDNIGIYIALFATMTVNQVIKIIILFYSLLLLSVVAALALVQVLF